jgi:hypothetical protein
MDEPIKALQYITINDFKNKLIEADINVDSEKEYISVQTMIDELVDSGITERERCDNILITCVKDKYYTPNPTDTVRMDRYEDEEATPHRAGYHEILLYDDDYNILLNGFESISDSMGWEKGCKKAILQKYYKPDKWKYGDVIGVINEWLYGYRNDGKFMWNGIDMILLDYGNDEYGAVPDTFVVGQHTNCAMYWSNIIDHNDFVFAKFDEAYVDRLEVLGPYVLTFYYHDEMWIVVTDTTLDYKTLLFKKPMLYWNNNGFYRMNASFYEFYVKTNQDEQSNRTLIDFQNVDGLLL